MNCPGCDTRMRVIDSRASKKHNVTWRRYRCPECRELLYTVEEDTWHSNIKECEAEYEQELRN